MLAHMKSEHNLRPPYASPLSLFQIVSHRLEHDKPIHMLLSQSHKCIDIHTQISVLKYAHTVHTHTHHDTISVVWWEIPSWNYDNEIIINFVDNVGFKNVSNFLSLHLSLDLLPSRNT